MDYDYLTRRMEEERQRAVASDNQAARDAHLQLAEHYRLQLEQLEGDSGQAQAASA